MSPIALSRNLGLFSLVLGGLEVAIPRTISRRLGVRGGPWLVRAFGVRELVAGLTILKDPSVVSGPASRVGGDVLDIAVLLPVVLSSSHRRKAAGIALGAVIGATVLDAVCTAALVKGEQRRAETARRTRRVRQGSTQTAPSS